MRVVSWEWNVQPRVGPVTEVQYDSQQLMQYTIAYECIRDGLRIQMNMPLIEVRNAPLPPSSFPLKASMVGVTVAAAHSEGGQILGLQGPPPKSGSVVPSR